jgi:hypothetical protein
LADYPSPFFCPTNSVSKGGLKVRKRKENIKPRKERTKQKKKKTESERVRERHKK